MGHLEYDYNKQLTVISLSGFYYYLLTWGQFQQFYYAILGTWGALRTAQNYHNLGMSSGSG